MSYHENCDNCGEDYDFAPEIAKLFHHFQSPVNYVEAVCPSCGADERIFVSPGVAYDMLKDGAVGILMGLDPHPDRAATWYSFLNDQDVEEVEGFHEDPPAQMELFLPDRELTGMEFHQLGDDIRKFERGELE